MCGGWIGYLPKKKRKIYENQSFLFILLWRKSAQVFASHCMCLINFHLKKNWIIWFRFIVDLSTWISPLVQNVRDVHRINSNRMVYDGGVWWNHLVSFFSLFSRCYFSGCARNTFSYIANSRESECFFFDTFEYAIREEQKKWERKTTDKQIKVMCICTSYSIDFFRIGFAHFILEQLWVWP